MVRVDARDISESFDRGSQPLRFGFKPALSVPSFKSYADAVKDGYGNPEPKASPAPYANYEKITRVSDGEIRYEVRDPNAKGHLNELPILKGVVFKNDNPELFETLDKYRRVHDAEMNLVGELNADWAHPDNPAPSILYPGEVDSIEEHDVDGQKAYSVKYAEFEKPYVFVEERNSEAFDYVETAYAARQRKKEYEAEDADVRRWLHTDVNKVPEFEYFIDIRDAGDGFIEFEYLDKNDGFKHKSGYAHPMLNSDSATAPDAYNQLLKMKEKLEDSIDKVNAHKEAHGLDLAMFNMEIADSSLLEIEPVEGLGRDAYKMIVYKDRDRKDVDKAYLVTRDNIGQEKFEEVAQRSRHGKDNEYWDTFESLGAKMWDNNSFETKNYVLIDAGLQSNISWVSTELMDKGYIIVKFKDGKHGNDLIVFDRQHTPEAFDVMKHHIETGDDYFNMTVPDVKPRHEQVIVQQGWKYNEIVQAVRHGMTIDDIQAGRHKDPNA